MSDWNDAFLHDRDGLPRGYVIVDAWGDQFRPYAPRGWLEMRAIYPDDELIAKAQSHLRVLGLRRSDDVRALAEKYEIVSAKMTALSPVSLASIHLYPDDAYAVPIAIAAKVFVTGRPLDRVRTEVRAEARIFEARIRGCLQDSWMRHTTSATSDQPSLSTADMDRGLAWPVTWGCFTNPGLASATLEIVVGNPSREYAIDVELFVFCQMYSCLSLLPARRPMIVPPIGGPYR